MNEQIAAREIAAARSAYPASADVASQPSDDAHRHDDAVDQLGPDGHDTQHFEVVAEAEHLGQQDGRHAHHFVRALQRGQEHVDEREGHHQPGRHQYGIRDDPAGRSRCPQTPARPNAGPGYWLPRYS